MMWPAAMTPAPSPVPTITDTDEWRAASAPKQTWCGVEGGRVTVVVVDHGQAQPLLDRAAEVEPVPAAVGEVRGSPRRHDALGAGGSGAVQAHGPDLVAPDSGVVEDQVEGLRDGLDGDVGPLLHAARQLDQAVHEEALRRGGGRWRCSSCRRCRGRRRPSRAACRPISLPDCINGSPPRLASIGHDPCAGSGSRGRRSACGTTSRARTAARRGARARPRGGRLQHGPGARARVLPVHGRTGPRVRGKGRVRARVEGVGGTPGGGRDQRVVRAMRGLRGGTAHALRAAHRARDREPRRRLRRATWPCPWRTCTRCRRGLRDDEAVFTEPLAAALEIQEQVGVGPQRPGGGRRRRQARQPRRADAGPDGLRADGDRPPRAPSSRSLAERGIATGGPDSIRPGRGGRRRGMHREPGRPRAGPDRRPAAGHDRAEEHLCRPDLPRHLPHRRGRDHARRVALRAVRPRAAPPRRATRGRRRRWCTRASPSGTRWPLSARRRARAC